MVVNTIRGKTYLRRRRTPTAMSDANDEDVPWPPAVLARQFQQAGEQAVEQQAEFLRRLSQPGFDGGFGQLAAMSRNVATFKTRVQSGGRISIPDAEREALHIDEGDIVQTAVIPIAKRGDSDE